MSEAFWQEVERTFVEAAALPMDDRHDWLDRLGLEAGVRREVDALLVSHDTSGNFLGSGHEGEAASGERWSPIGQTIAGFRLMELVGEGGMGVVYRAERVSGDFTQQVAFKLIDGIRRSAEAVQRFRSERQILASLTHPHIVMLLDGGVTERGEAYLVMEYVDGVPITDYCAHHRLAIDQRVSLVRQVCAAVQHAHRHGVVHRDLKPGNILVTREGVTKVLDFGIAKVVGRAPSAATTNGTMAALTPDYASPEQLRGQSVTTSSDIYSLGVLLHEIVAGTRPYQTAGLPLDAAIAAVVTGPAPRASDKAATAGDALPYPASRLKGDIDAVIAKAMSVEPERRYSSPNELSADLGRILAGEPVSARGPSFGYLAGKLARKHPVAIAMSCVALLALIAALVVSVLQTRIATRERDRAEHRFNDLRQLANALIFRIHDGVAPLPGSLEVRRAIVGEALTYLEKLSADSVADPQLQMELARGYHRVGTVQGRPNTSNLGDRPGAIRSLRASVRILESLAARPDRSAAWIRELVAAQVSLAETLTIDGARTEGVAVVERAVGHATQLVNSDASVENRNLLGAALFQFALIVERDRTIDAWTRAAGVYSALLNEAPTNGERQRNMALVHKYLGAQYAERGDPGSAQQQYAKALGLDQQRLDAAPQNRSAQFDVAIDLANLGNELSQSGQHAEAARHYEQSLALRQTVVDRDAKDVQAQGRLAYGHYALAREYVNLKRIVPALVQARAAVRIGQELARLDPYHQSEYAANLQMLGHALLASGDPSQACQAFESADAIVRELRKADVERQNTRLAKVEEQLPGNLRRCQSRSPTAKIVQLR